MGLTTRTLLVVCGAGLTARTTRAKTTNRTFLILKSDFWAYSCLACLLKTEALATSFFKVALLFFSALCFGTTAVLSGF